MYLKEDFSGSHSKIDYGKKGDEVEVIKIEGGMALVMGKELFHIREEKLTDTKPTIEAREPIKETPLPGRKKGKRSGTAKQNKLFNN